MGKKLKATLHQHLAVAQHVGREVWAQIEFVYMIIVVSLSILGAPPLHIADEECVKLHLLECDPISQQANRIILIPRDICLWAINVYVVPTWDAIGKQFRLLPPKGCMFDDLPARFI